MAFHFVPNAFIFCTPNYVVRGRNRVIRKRFSKYRRYNSRAMMKNTPCSSVDTQKQNTLNRAQFLQLFSLNFLTILQFDKIAAVTKTSAVEKKGLTETISEGLSKILTRKGGDQGESNKKDTKPKPKV
jgi:hypothetical protein